MQANAPAAASNGSDVFEFELPPMPRTLSEIMQLRHQEKPDMDRLVKVTSNDPAITAGVLRRVNAAYYSLRREVYQVERAILLLGFNEVCRLAFTASVKRAFVFKDAPGAQEVYTHIMRNGIATAAYARLLSETLNLMFTEVAFTAGLLHQLGRIALLYRQPKGYARMWRPKGQEDADVPLTPPSLRAEHFVFQTNSARLGAVVAQHWGLPENLTTAISFHHDYGQVANPLLRTLTLVVAAAGTAAERLFDDPENRTAEAMISDALAELAERRNVEVHDLAAVLDANRADVLHFTDVMGQE